MHTFDFGLSTIFLDTIFYCPFNRLLNKLPLYTSNIYFQRQVIHHAVVDASYFVRSFCF
jgi:hypothetical protein